MRLMRSAKAGALGSMSGLASRFASGVNCPTAAATGAMSPPRLRSHVDLRPQYIWSQVVAAGDHGQGSRHQRNGGCRSGRGSDGNGKGDVGGRLDQVDDARDFLLRSRASTDRLVSDIDHTAARDYITAQLPYHDLGSVRAGEIQTYRMVTTRRRTGAGPPSLRCFRRSLSSADYISGRPTPLFSRRSCEEGTSR